MLRSADVRLRSTILPFASRAILLAPLPIAEPLQDLPHVFANTLFRFLFIDHRSLPKLLRSLRRSTGRRSERRVRASTTPTSVDGADIGSLTCDEESRCELKISGASGVLLTSKTLPDVLA